MRAEESILLGITILILAGVAVLWMAMVNRRRIREMEHRERLAMIDRGLVPPPEVDPVRFEQYSGLTRTESPAAVRARSAGVILMGFGLAMVLLLAFAADSPEVGFGIGGAFALLGAAFFVNGALLSKSAPPPLPDWRSRPSSKTNGPIEPPPSSLP